MLLLKHVVSILPERYLKTYLHNVVILITLVRYYTHEVLPTCSQSICNILTSEYEYLSMIVVVCERCCRLTTSTSNTNKYSTSTPQPCTKSDTALVNIVFN